MIECGNAPGAFAAGFVNPFASGFLLDAILCGLILMVWVLHERSALGIKHGWVAIVLSFAMGGDSLLSLADYSLPALFKTHNSGMIANPRCPAHI